MNRVILMNCSRKLRNFTREMDELEEELNNSVKKIDAESENYTPKYIGEMKNDLNERMKKLIVQTQDKYKNTMNAFKDDTKVSIDEYISRKPDEKAILTLMALKGQYITQDEFKAIMPSCEGNYLSLKLLKEIVCPSEIYNLNNTPDKRTIINQYTSDKEFQPREQTPLEKMYFEMPKNIWRLQFKPMSAEEINKRIEDVETDASVLLSDYAGKNQGLVKLINPRNVFIAGDKSMMAANSSLSKNFLSDRKLENTVNMLANTFGMRELTDTEKSSLDKFYDGIYSDGSKKEKTKELINQEPGFYPLILKSQYKSFAEPANA